MERGFKDGGWRVVVFRRARRSPAGKLARLTQEASTGARAGANISSFEPAHREVVSEITGNIAQLSTSAPGGARQSWKALNRGRHDNLGFGGCYEQVREQADIIYKERILDLSECTDDLENNICILGLPGEAVLRRGSLKLWASKQELNRRETLEEPTKPAGRGSLIKISHKSIICQQSVWTSLSCFYFHAAKRRSSFKTWLIMWPSSVMLLWLYFLEWNFVAW